MTLINLDSLETASKLVNICNKYKDKTDVDIIYGRYIIDGCSILGVTSLVGNIIKVVPTSNDNVLIENMYKDLKEIGAWIVKNEF